MLGSLEKTTAKLEYIKNLGEDERGAVLNFLTPVSYDKKQYKRATRICKEKKQEEKSIASTDST